MNHLMLMVLILEAITSNRTDIAVDRRQVLAGELKCCNRLKKKNLSLPYDHSVGQTEVKLCLDFPQVPSVGLHYHCQPFCWRETAVRQSFPLVLDEGEKEALLGVSSAAVPLLTTAGGCP